MNILSLALAISLFVAAPAWGAFPVEASSAVANETAGTTTHDMTAPSGISSGELMLLIITFENVSNADPTASGVTGWTQVTGCTVTNPDASTGSATEVWYKFATGGETSTTYTSSASVKSVTRWLRFTGAHAVTPPECATATNDFVNPNSPSLTPSWGAADTLWYSIFSKYNGCDATTGYPSSYSLYQFGPGACTYDVQVAMAGRQLNATSDDPGDFTVDNTGLGVAVTLAIRPSAAAAGRRPIMPTVLQ